MSQSAGHGSCSTANYSFRGSFQHVLDSKGRVSVPSIFRSVLREIGQNRLVVTNYFCDGTRCLEGFGLDAWEQFEARLAERSRFDPKVKKLENYYLARAAECPIDGSGRINIPQHLIAYAGLQKEVVFTSTLNGMRIWDSRVWDLVFKEAEQALIEDPELFTGVDV